MGLSNYNEFVLNNYTDIMESFTEQHQKQFDAFCKKYYTDAKTQAKREKELMR
jgi:hypothetical protein